MLRAEAPNKKLTCSQVEIAQLVGFMKRWSNVSQKSVLIDSVSFDFGTLGTLLTFNSYFSLVLWLL